AESLLESPTGLIHFSMNVRVQLIPHDAAVAGFDGFGPMLSDHSRQQVIQAVMVFSYFLVFQGEGEDGLPAQAELRSRGNPSVQRLLDRDVLGRRGLCARA